MNDSIPSPAASMAKNAKLYAFVFLYERVQFAKTLSEGCYIYCKAAGGRWLGQSGDGGRGTGEQVNVGVR